MSLQSFLNSYYSIEIQNFIPPRGATIVSNKVGNLEFLVGQVVENAFHALEIITFECKGTC